MKPWQIRKLFNKVLVVLLCLSFLAQSSPLLAMSYEAQETAAANQAKTAAAEEVDQQNERLAATIVRVKPFANAASEPAASQETAATWPELRPNLTAKGAPIESNVTQAQAWSVDETALLTGWNLVSLPKIPPDSDPSAVLSGILGQTAVVFAYDGCQPANPWQVYDPAAPPATNDLTVIDQTKGFWLEANTATTLSFAGTLPPTTTIELCTGWNLIAMPAGQARPVRNALFSIEGKYSRVFGYEPEDAADPWTIYDVTAPDWANDLQMMEPGRGYWVLATENTTMTLANEGAPPIAEIHSPEETTTDLTSVTAITNVIGTAYSDFLAQWELDYRPQNGSEWINFAVDSTPVLSDVLEQFDPTLLLNGLYDIRLTATDYAGQSTVVSTAVIVEGQQKLGVFTLRYVDVQIPVVGLPIEVARIYDSRDKETGDFGVGWRLDLSNIRIEENSVLGENWESLRLGAGFPSYCILPTESNIVTVTFDDNTVYKFRPTITPACQPLIPQQVVAVNFEPLPGTEAELRAIDQDSQALVVGNFPSTPTNSPVDPAEPGTIELWNQTTTLIYDPGLYEMTLPDGRKLLIDQDVGLTEITDVFGNSLTVNSNGITHSNGVGLRFDRDEQGRIIRVTDPLSNTIQYTYDSRGDLIAVTDMQEATTEFTYDQNHYLLEIEDARGISPVRSEYDEDGRLIRNIDALGNVITYTHNLDARQQITTDRLGNITVYEYDERGNVLQVTDALGNVKSSTYDVNNNLTSSTDEIGNTTTITYADSLNFNKVTSVLDPLGNLHMASYDAEGRLLSVTDRIGAISTNAFNPDGSLASRTYPDDRSYTFEYSEDGNLAEEMDALGCVKQYAYDLNGNLSLYRNPRGYAEQTTNNVYGKVVSEVLTRTLPSGQVETMVTTYEYNSNNQLLKTTYPDGATYEFEYNLIGQKTAEIDELDRVTTFEYNALGYLIQINHPDNTIETYDHDAEGRQISHVDRLGNETRFEYDAVDRLIRTIYPDGTFITRNYDPAGRLVSITNERNHTIHFGYNANNYRTAITDTLGYTTTYNFDAVGHVLSEIDANGNTTEYEYDQSGRLTKVTYADGSTKTMVYDAEGRMVSETDQEGNLTRYTYDCAGNLISVTNALSQTTNFVYDEVNNLIAQIDANGHTTTFGYDNRGRLITRTLPVGQVETMAYDAVGNLLSKTDFNGDTITYTYDINNLITQKIYPGGQINTYTHNALGWRTSVTDDRGIMTYDYDPLGRITEIVQPDSAWLRYDYDEGGNQTAIMTVEGTTLYEYDSNDQLIRIIDPDNTVTTFAYDPVGNQINTLYPNGATTEYSYDELNRLFGLTNRQSDGTIFSDYQYALGASGQISQVVDHAGGSNTYQYDAIYQLLQETNVDPVFGSTTISYTYDAVGNRIFHTENGIPVAYTYDDNDRLLSQGNTSFTYDDNGNLITQVTPGGLELDYFYDYDNRLVMVNSLDGSTTTSVDFSYDADGNRVQSVVEGAEVVNYLVDTNRPLAQVLLETDQVGTVLNHYVYAGNLVSKEENGVRYFYHYDGQFNTRQITDPNETIRQETSYDAFGNTVSQSGDISNNYLYRGQLFVPELNAYYLRARYYQPDMGRFMTADPFPGLRNNPRTLHKYMYAHNDPVNLSDPSGLLVGVGSLSVGLAGRATIAGITIPNYLAIMMTAALVVATAEVSKCLQIQAMGYFGVYPRIFNDNPCSGKIPVIYFDYLILPDIAGHTASAQASGHPTVLHRTAPAPHPPTRHLCEAIYGVASPFEEQQCDEYPYWSTREGRSARNGSGALGLSVAWVEAGQNRLQGGYLNWFYSKFGCNIIPDSERRGVFGVGWIPIQTTLQPFTC